MPNPTASNVWSQHGDDGEVTLILRVDRSAAKRLRAHVKNDSEIRFSLSGDFGISDKNELATALRQGISYPTLIIDLAQTTFIDASVLGVLAELAHCRQVSHATPVRIIHMSDQIYKLFAICKMESIFAIEQERLECTSLRVCL